MNFVQLSKEQIKTEEVVSLVKGPECGAVSIFMGITREDNSNGLKVKSLYYEAYLGMAFKELQKICEEIRRKWPSIKNIAIYHRLGEVEVSESSVLIAVASPHRLESLEAVTFAINRVKSTVPIWKKEQYHNAPAVWKSNKECQWA